VKGAAKERLQEQAPAPPKAKARGEADSAKSVRVNGEPVVSPPPAVPAVTAPGDAQAQITVLLLTRFQLLWHTYADSCK